MVQEEKEKEKEEEKEEKEEKKEKTEEKKEKTAPSPKVRQPPTRAKGWLASASHAHRGCPRKGRPCRPLCECPSMNLSRAVPRPSNLDCYDSCEHCLGLGFPEDTRPRVCEMCGGSGIYLQRSSLLTITGTCSSCGGFGRLVDARCNHCESGRVSRKKRLAVEVPAGVVQGMKKIYEQEGDVGHCGGSRGDLIVVFSVEESPQFVRQGNDALTTVSVSFFQATLGDHIHIKGLLGQDVRLTIPPGTQPREVLVVEGEGFPVINSLALGRLLVQVDLVIPRSLTLRQAQLLFKTQQKWDKN